MPAPLESVSRVMTHDTMDKSAGGRGSAIKLSIITFRQKLGLACCVHGQNSLMGSIFGLISMCRFGVLGRPGCKLFIP